MTPKIAIQDIDNDDQHPAPPTADAPTPPPTATSPATALPCPASRQQNVQVWLRLHAEGYFERHPLYGDRLHTLGLQRLVDMLQPRSDDVLLDIGCGYGRLLWHLLPRVGRMVGIELAEPPLAEARRLVAGRGDCELVRTDGLAFAPIADASMTGVYAFTVFQHMTRQGVHGYLREVERVLAPGGRGCFQFFFSRATAATDIVDEEREQSIAYSAAQVCEVLEGNGLTLERLERECLEEAYPGHGFAWLWALARKPA